MDEPNWHVVSFASRDQLVTMPASMCCNCGTTTGIERRPATLTYADPFAGQQWLSLSVPTCAGCASTLRARAPGAGGMGALALALVFIGVFIAIPIVVAFALPLVMLAVLPTMTTIGALAAVRAWRGRALVGARVTNFQPVRFLGTDGRVLPTIFLSFANPAYATLVSAHCGQLGPEVGARGLPPARVVPSRGRGPR